MKIINFVKGAPPKDGMVYVCRIALSHDEEIKDNTEWLVLVRWYNKYEEQMVYEYDEEFLFDEKNDEVYLKEGYWQIGGVFLDDLNLVYVDPEKFIGYYDYGFSEYNHRLDLGFVSHS